MNIVILGSGRVGSRLASLLDAEGHKVTVVDGDPGAFDRLPAGFRGATIAGDGTDDAVLSAAGLREADVFIAVTQNDNRNLMAAQIAKHLFSVQKIVCRVYDPVRQEIFRDLGLRTFSPTTVLTDMIHETIRS
jgi:trk system potassium uptake protein TrkA